MKTTIEDLERVTYGETKASLTLAPLVEEIATTIQRYVELEAPELAYLLALWVVQTYEIETFNFCGFLSVQSASPRCGKSRLLEVLGCFTREVTPLRTMPSPAVLYRNQNSVIFLDEVDSLRNSDKERYGEIIALLNVAFKKGSVVERCHKQTLKVEAYPAYRVFAFAGLNSLADTLSDRCFTIRLRRSPVKMPRFNLSKVEMEARDLRAAICQWWEINSEQVKEVYDDLPDETPELKAYDDRLQDISEPLLVLALVADAEMGNGVAMVPRLLEALAYVGQRREGSVVEDNLRAFLDLADEQLGGREELFIPSKDILELCQEREGLEWLDNPRRLKGFLKKFEVFPKNQSGKVRGYWISREWVQEWRARYA